MLFQQLYNWIKYKTIPTSVLFKNRLFIERDSKQRRIMNNFGLTFRNSKWTNFENFNLQFKFKFDFLKIIRYFICIFLLILFTLLYSNYYSFSFVNNLYFYLWTGIDTFDYYISFFIWSFTIFFSVFFNTLRSYFSISDISSEEQYLKTQNIKRLNKQLIRFVDDQLPVSKTNYKWFIFSWLNSSHHPSSTKYFIFSSLFNSSLHTSSIYFNQLLMNLFKNSYLLNLSTNSFTFYQLSTKLQFTKKPIITNPPHSSFWAVTSFCDLNKNLDLFIARTSLAPSLSYLTTSFEWNLINLAQRSSSASTYLANFNSYNFYSLNNTHPLLNLILQKSYFFFPLNSIQYEFNTNKQTRWLYKYSLLHRKIFKNSHKTTMVKKLFNGNIINNDLTNSNLWYSKFLYSYSNKNTPHYLFNSLHPTFFLKNNNKWLNHTLSPITHRFFKNNLFNSSHYETSFFWNLHRFFFFNSLDNTTPRTNYKLFPTTNKFPINNNNMSLNTLFNAFLGDFYFSNSELNFNSLKYDYIRTNINNLSVNSLSKDDVSIFFNDIQYFNKTNSYLLKFLSLPAANHDYSNTWATTFFNIFKNYNQLPGPSTSFLVTDSAKFNPFSCFNDLQFLLTDDLTTTSALFIPTSTGNFYPLSHFILKDEPLFNSSLQQYIPLEHSSDFINKCMKTLDESEKLLNQIWFTGNTIDTLTSVCFNHSFNNTCNFVQHVLDLNPFLLNYDTTNFCYWDEDTN